MQNINITSVQVGCFKKLIKKKHFYLISSFCLSTRYCIDSLTTFAHSEIDIKEYHNMYTRIIDLLQ